MLSWIRDKFGGVLVVGIIGFIAFVFVFSDLIRPKATRGIHEGAVAGTVNGDAIPLAEFNRAYGRQVEYFRQMMGGNVSEDQLKAFRFKDMVFNELVQRRLRLQQADHMGLTVSDEQVRDTIREVPAFKKDGKFDVLAYKQVLDANGYHAGSFERTVREDLLATEWSNYFRDRVQVTDEEARREFIKRNEKRKIKYVMITLDAAKKAVPVTAAEVSKALADPNKLNLAKSQYEARKAGEFKGKTFDQVKDQLAREMVSSDKFAEAQKVQENLAGEVQAALSASAAGDAKVNAIVKNLGAKVVTSDWVSSQSSSLPNVGEAAALLKDAFAAKSPINPAHGGKAGKYSVAQGTLVALVLDAQNADLSKFDAERASILEQLTQRKAGELAQGAMAEVTKKAKVERNPEVVGDGSG